MATVLVVVGAANWGLVGIADVDLVAVLFGAGSPVARLVYCQVRVAGLFQTVQ